MSQVTIYLDDDKLLRAKAAAASSRQSLSAWIAGLIQQQTRLVDANGYPPGFFEQIRANADAWADFPTLEEIRATDTADTPREVW